MQLTTSHSVHLRRGINKLAYMCCTVMQSRAKGGELYQSASKTCYCCVFIVVLLLDPSHGASTKGKHLVCIATCFFFWLLS